MMTYFLEAAIVLSLIYEYHKRKKAHIRTIAGLKEGIVPEDPVIHKDLLGIILLSHSDGSVHRIPGLSHVLFSHHDPSAPARSTVRHCRDDAPAGTPGSSSLSTAAAAKGETMNALFFLVVPISWYLFYKQEQRHRFERSLFLTFDQLDADALRPQRDLTESFLVLFVGLTVSEVGGAILWTTVQTYLKIKADANMPSLVQDILPQQILFGAIMAGGGIAMMVLGVRSVLANRRFHAWKKLKETSTEAGS
jgi:hypothetical protein